MATDEQTVVLNPCECCPGYTCTSCQPPEDPIDFFRHVCVTVFNVKRIGFDPDLECESYTVQVAFGGGAFVPEPNDCDIRIVGITCYDPEETVSGVAEIRAFVNYTSSAGEVVADGTPSVLTCSDPWFASGHVVGGTPGDELEFDWVATEGHCPP